MGGSLLWTGECMRDTPRTDELLDSVCKNGNTDFECYDKLIDFARQLECELNETKEQLEFALNPVHTCSSQCQRAACRWRRVADILAKCLNKYQSRYHGCDHAKKDWLAGGDALAEYSKLKTARLNEVD